MLMEVTNANTVLKQSNPQCHTTLTRHLIFILHFKIKDIKYLTDKKTNLAM